MNFDKLLEVEITDYVSIIAESKKENDTRELEFFFNYGVKRRVQIAKEILETTTLIVLNPDNTELLYQRANLYNSINECKLAAKDCKKAFSILSSSEKTPNTEKNKEEIKIEKSKVLVELSNAYNGLNKHEEGKKTAEKAIMLNKDNSNAYLECGKSMENTGEKNKTEYFVGIMNCEEAIRINPDNVKAHLRLSILQRKTGNFEKSNEILEFVEKKLDREQLVDHQYFGCKGVNLLHEENYEQSLFNIIKSVLIEPRRSSAWNNIANDYYHLKMFDKAIERYNIAIEMEVSEDDVYYCNRGGCLSKLGDQKGAVDDLRRSIQINPDSFSGYYNLASLLCIQEKFDKAEEYLSKSIEINPSSHRPYLLRSKMLLRRFEDELGFQNLIKSHSLHLRSGLLKKESESWLYTPLLAKGDPSNSFWVKICRERVTEYSIKIKEFFEVKSCVSCSEEDVEISELHLYRGWACKCLEMYEEACNDFMKTEKVLECRHRMEAAVDELLELRKKKVSDFGDQIIHLKVVGNNNILRKEGMDIEGKKQGKFIIDKIFLRILF